MMSTFHIVIEEFLSECNSLYFNGQLSRTFLLSIIHSLDTVISECVWPCKVYDNIPINNDLTVNINSRMVNDRDVVGALTLCSWGN